MLFRTTSPSEQQRVLAAAAGAGLLSRLLAEEGLRERVEQILLRHARLRSVEPGEVVFRRGDFGSEVQLVITGSLCEVVRDPDGLVSVPPPPGTISAAPRWRFPGFRRQRDDDIVVVDTRFRQSLDNLPGILAGCELRRFQPESGRDGAPVPGELPGALSVLTRAPFPRFVFAETASRLLSLHWRGIDELVRLADDARQVITRQCRQEIFDLVRTRDIEIPFLAGLPAPALESLPEALEYRLYDETSARRTAVRQGEPTRHVLVVISGFGRITCQTGDQSRSVGFVRRGDAFGLAAVASGGADAPSRTSLDFLGGASLLALPAEWVANNLIGGLTRQDILAVDPAAEVEFGRGTGTRSRELARRSREANLIDFLVENSLVRGREAMVIDQTRCVGCDACVQACADTHGGVPRFVRQGPASGGYAVANACMHCEEAPCLVNCPTDAIFRKHSAEVVVSEVLCIGCGTCASACPYDNIRLVELGASAGEKMQSTPLALKCDLCIEQEAGPACVRACPHDAIARVDLTDHGVVPQLADAVNLRHLRREKR